MNFMYSKELVILYNYKWCIQFLASSFWYMICSIYNVTSSFQHLVLAPGSSTWFQHLVLAPGSSIWFQHLVLASGSSTWFQHLVLAPGSSTWFYHLVSSTQFPAPSFQHLVYIIQHIVHIINQFTNLNSYFHHKLKIY